MTYQEELAALRIALKRSREREAAAFDRGFEAATRLAEAGATPERLREAAGVPCVIARARTEPVRIIIPPPVDEWANDTEVDP